MPSRSPHLQLLAGPGVLFCTALTGLVVKYIMETSFSWSAALLLGAIVSATDPVAVVKQSPLFSEKKRKEKKKGSNKQEAAIVFKAKGEVASGIKEVL
jgi:NhaP-type Na+/H+ and K+/H+ antiporter